MSDEMKFDAFGCRCGETFAEIDAYYAHYDQHVKAEGQLERRERIATAILAAFFANPYACDRPDSIKVAVSWADALMKELEKP